MTACETWFYFAMAGLLGMIGMMWLTIQPHIKPVWLLAAIVLVIGALSVRTASRGLIWERPETLARTDIAVSPDDYNANYILAGYLIKQGRFSQAKTYAQDSVNLYPTYNNYNNLGLAMTGLGNYSAAVDAYDHALHYSDYPAVVENLGLLALLTGTYTVQKQLLSIALKNYPQDAKLWIYLAIVEQRGGDAADAKTAIAQAQSYGSVSSNVYQGIINNQPFVFPLTGINRSIYVP